MTMKTKMFGKVAAAAAMLAAGAAFTPGLAQESATKEEEKVERIIILEHKDGEGHGDGVRVMRRHVKEGDGKVRRIHIARDGDGPRHFAMVECEGEKTRIDEATGKEKTKIVLCGKDGLNAEERAARLEEIRAKLADREHLSAEHRAKVEAALTEAITRLRASN